MITYKKVRISQVFSNLIGNAVQYSFSDSVIEVVVKGTEDEVVLSVHNEAYQFPDKMPSLFDFLTRVVSDDENPGSVNLGLGLYKGYYYFHGGTIDVISTEEDGATFTADLPRSAEMQ